MTRKSWISLTSLFFFLIFIGSVGAEGWDPNALVSTNLPTRSVADILLSVIDWAITLVGIMGVLIFIYGGFIYMTARGESDKIEQAKKILLYGVIGIVVSVLGLIAVKTVDNLLRGDGSTAASSTGSNVPSGSASDFSGNPAPSSSSGATPGTQEGLHNPGEKFVAGSIADLKVGADVMIEGGKNSDGSVNATVIRTGFKPNEAPRNPNGNGTMPRNGNGNGGQRPPQMGDGQRPGNGIFGKITAVNGQNLMVQSAEGSLVVVKTSGATSIMKNAN